MTKNMFGLFSKTNTGLPKMQNPPAPPKSQEIIEVKVMTAAEAIEIAKSNSSGKNIAIEKFIQDVLKEIFISINDAAQKGDFLICISWLESTGVCYEVAGELRKLGYKILPSTSSSRGETKEHEIGFLSWEN